jgi:hypothetical protein
VVQRLLPQSGNYTIWENLFNTVDVLQELIASGQLEAKGNTNIITHHLEKTKD